MLELYLFLIINQVFCTKLEGIMVRKCTKLEGIMVRKCTKLEGMSAKGREKRHTVGESGFLTMMEHPFSSGRLHVPSGEWCR